MLGKFGGGDGSENNPYLIEDAFDLDAVRNNLSSNYKLIKDIDLNVRPFNEGEGWKPIDKFKGVLDGDGKTIKNLYMNNPLCSVGLFDNVIKNAIIQNIQIQNINISAGSSSGILIGTFDGGRVENCCVKNGKVTVTRDCSFGTLSGNAYYDAKTTNCYASNINIDVLCDTARDIGNLVGYAAYTTILKCYSNCKVNIKKGLIGNNVKSYIADSYWDVETSEQTNSDGGIGKTTQEMKTPSTYIDWDKEKTDDGKPVWILKEGQYPKLWFEKEYKFLLKQNDKYYSIKNEFYKNNQYQPLEIQDLSINTFKQYGFDDVSDICEEIKHIKKYSIKKDIDKGQLFEFDLNGDFNDIDIE